MSSDPIVCYYFSYRKAYIDTLFFSSVFVSALG